jgi:class 3 adenylate cyclase
LVELIRGNWSLARRAIADAIFPSGPTKDQRRFSSYLRESISPEIAARYLDFQTSVDVTAYMSLVKAPTLVIHRRGDRNLRIAAGRAAAALIEDARFLALEGDNAAPFVGDVSHLETVRAFLDDRPVEMPGGVAAEGGGFQTILFTDIEGSTALTERLGDKQARDLLRERERITREALATHGGSEVKTMGDGFMASFSSATSALECAVALQQSFAERNESTDEAVRIRIGLNAGEPIEEDDPGGRSDLFGTAVNMAARIAAKAEGGEILASNVVRELVAGKNFLFNDRGETELRGFEDPVRLFEVSWKENN